MASQQIDGLGRRERRVTDLERMPETLAGIRLEPCAPRHSSVVPFSDAHGIGARARQRGEKGFQEMRLEAERRRELPQKRPQLPT
jgi:hypothetical protein